MTIDRRRFLTAVAGTAVLAAGCSAHPHQSASDTTAGGRSPAGTDAAGTGAAGTEAAGTGAATSSAPTSSAASAAAASRATSASSAAPAAAAKRVRAGVEVFMASGYRAVRGQKVGLVTNPTGILPDLRHEVDVMHADHRINLAAVFGPEHGFRGTVQVGGTDGISRDPQTGLAVFDTYGKSGQALAEQITRSGVDTVIFDIQDIGARFYTYIWTLYDTMAAAALAGKRFVVLDRPNAISGREALGPVMHAGYETFVGRKPVSQVHGMTVGELAKLYNAEWIPADTGRRLDLTVVPMDGWSREMYFEQTGLPWVPPSPSLPTVDCAVVYAGTGLFEATNLSEGRGTARPFEQVAAPYCDWHWCDALRALDLPGAAFRACYVSPTVEKYAGKTIAGVQLYVTDRDAFDPVRTAIAMIVTTKKMYPKHFSWHSGVSSDDWIDLLTGSTQVRTAVDAGKGTDAVVAGWQRDLAAFRKLRQKYLIYPSS